MLLRLKHKFATKNFKQIKSAIILITEILHINAQNIEMKNYILLPVC